MPEYDIVLERQEGRATLPPTPVAIVKDVRFATDLAMHQSVHLPYEGENLYVGWVIKIVQTSAIGDDQTPNCTAHVLMEDEFRGEEKITHTVEDLVEKFAIK